MRQLMAKPTRALSHQMGDFFRRITPTSKALKKAAIYALLASSLKGVGAAFRALGDFKNTPWDVQKESLQREGTVLGIIGATTFVSQLYLGSLFNSLNQFLGKSSREARPWLNNIYKKWPKQFKAVKKALSKKGPGRNNIRMLMLFPIYIGAEMFSRHVGKIDFNKMFSPSNQIGQNPLAYSQRSFITPDMYTKSSHTQNQTSYQQNFSPNFRSNYRAPSFSHETPYHLSFARQSSSLSV